MPLGFLEFDRTAKRTLPSPKDTRNAAGPMPVYNFHFSRSIPSIPAWLRVVVSVRAGIDFQPRQRTADASGGQGHARVSCAEVRQPPTVFHAAEEQSITISQPGRSCIEETVHRIGPVAPAEGSTARFRHRENLTRIVQESSPGELRSEALAEPSVRLSPHSAPIRQTNQPFRFSNVRRCLQIPTQAVARTGSLGFCSV